MRNTNHHPLWVLFAIVALTFGGLATLLGVYISNADTGTERSVTLIGSILAFVAPTIAALLALLRADEAKTTIQNVDEKLTRVHEENTARLDENTAKLDVIEKKVNGTGI